MTVVGSQQSAAARQAVIFDLDGVLIDSEALQYKAYSQVLARFGVSVSVEEYARHWVATGRGPEHAVATYALPVSPAELRELKRPVYGDILRREVTLMPGAIAAVTRLSAAFPLALATNSYQDDVDFVMQHCGLGAAFTAIVSREHYVRAKPEPDAFVAAAEFLQVLPSSCVVVEDAYRGILAAHRAGARPVAIPNSFTAGSDFSLATRVLRSLDELTVALVKELLGVEP